MRDGGLITLKELAPYVVAITTMLTIFSPVAYLSSTGGGHGAASACPCSEIAKPPAEDNNVNVPKGLEFTHTEEYEKEFAAAIAGARAACEKHLGEAKVAIVADIDETLFDNRQEFAEHPEFKWSYFAAWLKKSDAPLLKPTAELLSWARDNGFAIFLVTGRHEKHRADTIVNLIRNKVAYDGLYMRNNTDSRPAEDFKTEARTAIQVAGFKVIVSIGDQFSDLYGGFAEDCEKLPNRMYYIP